MGNTCIHLALRFLPVQKEVLLNPSLCHTPIQEPLILHLNYPSPTYILIPTGYPLGYRRGLVSPSHLLAYRREGALVKTFSLSLGPTAVALEVSGSSREGTVHL